MNCSKRQDFPTPFYRRNGVMKYKITCISYYDIFEKIAVLRHYFFREKLCLYVIYNFKEINVFKFILEGASDDLNNTILYSYKFFNEFSFNILFYESIS